MADTLTTLLQSYLYKTIILISISAAAMLVAMVIDLYFGVKKAKENKQATTSKGLKKTCDKARKYFMPFLVLMLIDIMAAVVLPAPFFSMLWAAYCVYCEFVSVREKAWTKAELQKAENTMNVIVENKEDIARMVIKLLEQQNSDKSDDTQSNTQSDK
jgi:hypothetical protein